MKNKLWTIEIEVTQQRIVDLFITACEGGSNYWCRRLSPLGEGPDAYEAMLAGFTAWEMDESGGPDKKHVVTAPQIVSALKLFAWKQPRHFGDFLSENDDAITGDVFLQLCVFGEVIYG